MTRLVGVVTGPTISLAQKQIAKANPYADLFELRLDLFDPQELNNLDALPRLKPWIFTFRKQSQGGACDLPEHERLALFARYLELEPDYCDIEADTDLAFFEQIKERHPKMRVIGSFHDFSAMPHSLDEVLAQMHRPHISSYKIAVAVHSVLDLLRLLSFARKQKQLTCIGLGPEGIASRILAPIVGSEFCYGSIEEGPSLPNIDLQELSDVYQIKAKSTKTKIYALLGDPVEKSIGPLFHNRHFSKEAIYVKFRVAIPELTCFFSLARQLPFKGFSITMPLKEQLEPFLTRIAPTAASIGSVNTIVIERDHLIGYNTDGAAALAVLSKHCPHIKGLKAIILGAGGSARAIAYELQRNGVSVLILNRTLERAEALAAAFHCKAGKLEDLGHESCDILINTIPIHLVFDPNQLPSASFVMDIVYWEAESPLLKMAKERGATCVKGTEVFEEQALMQQKLWFSKKKD